MFQKRRLDDSLIYLGSTISLLLLLQYALFSGHTHIEKTPFSNKNNKVQLKNNFMITLHNNDNDDDA